MLKQRSWILLDDGWVELVSTVAYYDVLFGAWCGEQGTLRVFVTRSNVREWNFGVGCWKLGGDHER